MTKKMTISFYRNLGKLFYAIAAVDGEVNPKEFTKLKTAVKSHWLEVDEIEDTFGTDAAYQIEIVFDWLNEVENFEAQTCFEDFVSYKRAQGHLFTEPVRKLIMETATAIAYAFSGVNKSELSLLAKLDMELKKI
ncbi:hypothetical protein [Winogradskyella rapida]|uniref:Tellurite resistance protein TerB n=1 Tax=Winogradskyella rapida TaxID=549701 RepID=A0ABW3KSX6_9FLAO